MALEVLDAQHLTRGRASMLAKIRKIYVPASEYLDILIIAKAVKGN
jgi:hypothetical protein